MPAPNVPASGAPVPEMPGSDRPGSGASTPARDAIDAFLRHLADRDLSATTRRIRKTYLNEYLRHAQQAAAEATARRTRRQPAARPRGR